MQEIRCPECGKIFQIDESDYSKIVSQVRDAEFSKEMEFRVKHFEKEKEDAIQIIKAQEEKNLADQISRKDAEIQELRAKLEKSDLEKSMAVKET